MHIGPCIGRDSFPTGLCASKRQRRRTLRTEESTMSEDTPTPDDTAASESEHRASLAQNLKSRATWLRLFFMLVMALLYSVSRVVIGALVLLQFFWVLFTGRSNVRLLNFGQSLATYTYQIVRYLTYNTEERPFPFDADWPAGPV